MPHYEANPQDYTPFGANEFLRSTKNLQFDHYTLSAASVPTETIDGSTQKVLKRGEVLAKITSGAESGKVGPFQADATDGRQTAANIVGLADTFVPWQLLRRDVEVAAVYHGTVVQALCTERDTAGARIALTDATLTTMRGTKNLDILAR